jgi:predicted permease
LLLADTSLAVVLLVGAGLFASSFLRFLSVDLGMDHRNVLSLPMMRDHLDAAIDRLGRIPGVEAVAAIDQNIPLGEGASRYSLKVPGREVNHLDDDAVRPHWVTPGYLSVMRLPLLKGRWLEPADADASLSGVVLSEEAARRYFRGRDPLGAVVDMSGRQAMVVGVVGSVRLGGPEVDLPPQIYFPHVSRAGGSVWLFVRTREAPDRSGVIPAVKAAIWSVEPTMPLPANLGSLEDAVNTLVAPRRFNMVILSMFGVMGTLIAAIGIYGVMAFVVAQRTQEIGIRMALGAQPGRIRRSVLWNASRFLLLGLAIGLATAAALAGRLEGLLFQVQPRDVVVYAGASFVLLAAGLAAAYLPARRASRVDPLIALRAE